MDLQLTWFVLIAVLWIGYLVLEGFDFGVGMLMPILDKNRDGKRDDRRRRLMLNTIAPVWDGNEVWLLTAGGATFAAFPDWYATLFSGFYLPLLLILVALIIRGLAFEYRGKRDNDAWRARWDWCIIIGSYLTPLLWGVAFANILAGVAINENKKFTGTLFDLLNPYGLLGGAALVTLFMFHGAVFISLKTGGEMRQDAAKLAHRLSYAATGVVAAFALWTQIAHGKTWTWAIVAIAAACLVAAIFLTKQHSEGKAFLATTITIAGAVILLFGSLWPNVMVSTDAQYSLTVRNASSTDYTLMVMTWVAVALTPVVVGYQAWTYWVFRRRLTVDHIPKPAGLGSGSRQGV